MYQLTSTTQSKMSMISWSRAPPLLLRILSNFQAQRSLTGSRSAVHLSPWFGVLARRVLVIFATLEAPERLFSTAGNVMTKNHSSLTCDNMKELIYLHEVWPQVQDWEAVKKMRLE